MERSYNVWRYEKGAQVWTGIVRATNHTLATTKAQRLFRGFTVWVEEKLPA
jgi:hypothetical protein